MFKRDNFSGGGGRRGGGGFGGGGFKPRGDRDDRFGGGGNFGGPRMFETTCAACGQRCEVPFRPNGSKPTYCRDCFQKQGGGQRDRFEGGGHDRPNFRDRQPAVGGGDCCRKTEERLVVIEGKLERILIKLEAMERTEERSEKKEKPEKKEKKAKKEKTEEKNEE